jgi:hypothetical protein
MFVKILLKCTSWKNALKFSPLSAWHYHHKILISLLPSSAAFILLHHPLPPPPRQVHADENKSFCKMCIMLSEIIAL